MEFEGRIHGRSIEERLVRIEFPETNPVREIILKSDGGTILGSCDLKELWDFCKEDSEYIKKDDDSIHEDCRTDDDVSDAQNEGYSDGKSAGREEGYDDGYEEGKDYIRSEVSDQANTITTCLEELKSELKEGTLTEASFSKLEKAINDLKDI